jgi:hypothetical protein
MESVQDSKKSGKVYVLKPGIDGSTLKDTAFNDHRWGDVTRDYVTSVKKLTEESFKEICSRARQMSKFTRKGGRSGSPSVEDAPKRIGRRAQLLDACEFTLQHLLYTALSCSTGARTILRIIV